MPFVIGVVFAVLVGIFARRSGLDRDRAFYPVVTIIVAHYYILFAVLGHSTRALLLDSLVGAMFLIIAVIGYQRSLWIVAVLLASHGVLDLVHANFISNPSVPTWWPGWCLGYDVAAAAFLAWLLKSGGVRARA